MHVTQRLNENLRTKLPLRFRRDGSFKILMLSDYQETIDFDERTLRGTRAIVRATAPDLILLGGDIPCGPKMKTPDELRAYLDVLVDAFGGVPFCHVFGNHDYDIGFPANEATAIYEAIPTCVSKHTAGIHGETNYMLTILASDSGNVRFAVWCLDTGNRIESFRAGITDEARPEGHPTVVGPWDGIRFDQMAWYWNSSCELEAYAGHKVPALMAMHVAPWEITNLQTSPAGTGAVGASGERYNLSAFNSGIFFTALQRGDVCCIASGHTHENDVMGTYCGIKLCNVSSAGYAAYGIDERRGGRLFTLREDAPEKIETEMVYYKDHI